MPGLNAGTPALHAPTYAKRFAAKEACAKALGTGFKQGVFHSDMGVVNLASGQPTLRLTGGAAARLDLLTPRGMGAHVALTMTDEYPYGLCAGDHLRRAASLTQREAGPASLTVAGRVGCIPPHS